MKKIYSLLFLLLSAAAFSQYKFSDIDAILANFNKPDSPGLTVHVVKDGKVLYSKQAGMADIENKKLINKESVFHMASDSKQFVAASIVLLQQKGKLNFDDKLSKYFPDFPDYAQKVTIANLLNHTSGIKDIGVLAMLKGEDAMDYYDNQVRELLKNSSLDFEPGAKWSYSNSGYWFLAQIVQQVSGRHLKEFVRDNVFKPLKMKHSRFVDSRDTQFANKVKGYEEIEGKNVPSTVDPYHIAGAGLYAPVEDLQKWLNEMMDQKLLGKAFWQEMLKVTTKNGYASGLTTSDFGGHKKIFHGGDNPGFHSIMGVYPTDRLSVIVIANNDNAAPKNIEQTIAAKVLGIWGEDVEEAPEAISEFTIAPETLKQYVGIYESKGSQFLLEPLDNSLQVIQVYNDAVYDITPESQTSFGYAGLVFTFEDVVNGLTQTMVINQDGSDQKFARITLPQNLKAEYSGSYYCKSLDVKYTLLQDGEILKYKIADGLAQEVAVSSKDKVYTDIGIIKLKRDTSGKISGFVLSHSRASNIEFERI